MAEFEKYLEKTSEGTSDWVPEAYGYLVRVESPAEQGLKDRTKLKLSDDTKIKVPTSWKAVIMTEDGEEVAWRWPGYIDKDSNSNELGLNIISPRKTKFKKLFDKKSIWHFYRDGNRRAHVEPAEEE